MNPAVRIALIGDRNPAVAAHVAIPTALARSGVDCEPVWFGTANLNGNVVHALSDFHGIWCVPGSPYQDMNAALAAIRFAREKAIPFLGTCGGFQHALIEYARNVLGLVTADHEESNPGAAFKLITRLSCPLSGVSAPITAIPGTFLARIYGGATRRTEPYQCRFGLTREAEAQLTNGGLRVAARDDAGEVRAVELPGHPFFIGTLFQPERSEDWAPQAHPVVRAFVCAAKGFRDGAKRPAPGHRDEDPAREFI